MDRDKHQEFAERFVRGQNRVYRFILTLVPNRVDAEDLFQQTNLTLWQRWEQYDPSRDFVAWACGIAHNHVRNFVRTRAVRDRSGRLYLSEDVLDQLAATRIEHDDLLEQRRMALAACLDKLEARQRELVEQCYAGDETFDAIARSTGQTPNALYKTLRRIRHTLFKCINGTLDTGGAA